MDSLPGYLDNIMAIQTLVTVIMLLVN